LFSFISRFSLALYLLLAMSAQATAMTAYDVIQLSKKSYSDQDIIALIKNTDSAFELQAADISQLVDLGVSDLVIQAMVKAVPAETPVYPAPELVLESAPGKYYENRFDHRPGNESATVYITPGNSVPRADIDSEPLEEPGSGGHSHQVITLSGIRLFVLRDEGGYPTVTARVRVVADQLRSASAMGDGQFHPAHVAGRDAVMFTANGTGQTIMVVSVSAQDASAYQRRSDRLVTPDLLAAYWSDLLTDYWSLALDGQPPNRLPTLHEGWALQVLYDALDASVDNNTDRLTSAYQSLPKRERDHLTKLAVSVPRTFDAIDKHTGESP